MGYLPVRLSTLKEDITLGFDLYLQLPHKTIKYIDSNDIIEIERISNLKAKKVRKLYILDSEEELYQTYIDRCLDEAMNDSSISLEDKSSLVLNASENNAERIMADPHSQKSYNLAKNTASKLIEVLSQNDELLKGIFDHKLSEEADSHESRMHKHAVNTSSLCISFGEYLNLSKDSIQNLGIAGLFHDISFGQVKEDFQKLFFIPLNSMTAEQMTLYKTHPKIGAEVLQDKDFASAEVIELILSHEERLNGGGYPNKLNKMSMEQEILALTAYYDQRVTCFNEKREAVLEDLAINLIGMFTLDLIKSFKAFLAKSGLK